MGFMAAIPIIGSIVQAAGDMLKGWQERKTVVAKGKVKIAQARVEGTIKRMEQAQAGDIEYDKIVAKGMEKSWKDEFFVIILSIPAVLCFIPGMDIYVTAGFIALQQTPEWYQWAFLGAIIASFGLKSLKDWKMK